MALPKLIVFDLDYTLWPFWVDCQFKPPFKVQSGVVCDAYGSRMTYYPEVPSILEHLSSRGIDMAVASRTTETNGAYQLLDLFDWEKYFKYKEIYPGRKTEHFRKFAEASGLAYKDMLFFDDEMRNVRDINGIGATAYYVDNGMTHEELKKGLKMFAEKRKR